MKKSCKFYSIFLLVFAVGVGILSNVTQISSKADGTSSVRDTNLSVDTQGKLTVKRNKVGNTPMGNEDSWTIFVYLCGSDLESNYGEATKDVKEMMAGKYNENVNIVVQTGGAKAWWYTENMSTLKTYRYLIKNNKKELIESMDSQNMGQSNTLKDFLNWGVAKYPAEHMGVILWNHGGGSVDGVCFDEKNDYDSLSLGEMEKAFNVVSKSMTDKFEFVGFDACLMATVETANMLVPYADYMIASEEAEPSGGWDYKSIVNKLAENPDVDTEELGKTIVDSYYATIENEYSKGTLSLVNLTKLDELLEAFNIFAKNLNEKTDDVSDITNWTKKANGSENFGGNNLVEGYYNMVDLGNLVKNMSGDITDSSSVLSALEKVVVYQKVGNKHKNATGLAMYYPLKAEGMVTYNTLRNIVISPFYMEYLDKVFYGCKYNSLKEFESNKWTESAYYFDKDFTYLDYIYETSKEYFEKYKDTEYFSKATFDDNWYTWFNKSAYDSNGGNSNSDSGNSDGSYTDWNQYLIDYMNTLEQTDLTQDLINWLNGTRIDVEDNKEKAKKYISAEYQLAIKNMDQVNVLGSIVDVNANVEDMDFDNTWFALSDGQFLQAELIDEGNGLKLYACPAIVNGKKVSIQFIADKMKNVLVLGAWDAIGEKGQSGKGYRSIESGSVVIPLYTSIDKNNGEISTIQGNEMIVSDGKLIENKELDTVNTYIAIVELIDTFGNVTYSSPNIK